MKTMKKILISLLLISLFMNNVYAETYSGNFSISLSYNKLPTYTVKIPTTIDVSNNTTPFNYYVSGDIYADQSLQVLFDSNVTLYSQNNTCNAQVSQEKAIFNQNELTNSYTKYGAVITHQKLTSGSWTGELNVVISLIGGAQ